MRGLERLPEPQILVDRKGIWLSKFLASGNKRPDSNKYGHPTVLTQLNSMSFHKCFYCETKLKGAPKEIDHQVEVSVDKNLAYEWTNFFLSCDNCNNKIPHNIISICDALDPCINTDEFIEEHLTFNKELIVPKNNSGIGLNTIKKYRLDTELLDTRRLKQISLLQDLLLEIRKNQISENRSNLTSEEIYIINSFKRIDNPYSLMFKVLIEKYGL